MDIYLWEWARANEEELHVTYLDCNKAYESVPTWLTRAALARHKVPEGVASLVLKLDDVADGRRVVTEEGLTAWVTFEGMAQGESVIPPRGWDEAVRTLGVWRAVSGKCDKEK